MSIQHLWLRYIYWQLAKSERGARLVDIYISLFYRSLRSVFYSNLLYLETDGEHEVVCINLLQMLEIK